MTANDHQSLQRALQARENELCTIFEASLDGIFILDLQGRFLLVNDVACEMTGYTREELLRMEVADLKANEEAGHREARMETVRAQGWGRFESVHRRKDGTELDVEVSIKYAPIEGGRLVGFVRDISARKAAVERYQALTEHSGELTLVLDDQGNVTFVSPASRQFLGLEPEALVGTCAADLVHPDDQARVFEQMGALVKDRAVRACFEVRLRRASGGWMLLEAEARNLLDVPAIGGFVINHRDLTERNRLREQFHQAQRLEPVGRLTGGVAHDFNNLLTVMLSCSDAVLDALGPVQSATRAEVQEIRAAAERARELTTQLLALVRKQLSAPSAIDLNEMVLRQQRMLTRLLGEDVELEVRLERPLWPVFADGCQLVQVLLNLVVNARDAMPRGGRLVIETRSRKGPEGSHAVGEHGPEGHPAVLLRVTDSGSGMSAEVTTHLFEPFFTTKEPGKGTGLGLATVQGIVAQAGGTISVESLPGRGTTFEISFPIAAGPLAVGPPDRDAPALAARGEERILVVEDDAHVRGVVFRLLRGQGYQALPVADPRLALELPAEELREVSLLLTDVVMPGLDGYELARELKARHPGLKVLYFSGHSPEALEERGGRDEGPVLLPKPLTMGDLLAKVREVLDQ